MDLEGIEGIAAAMRVRKTTVTAVLDRHNIDRRSFGFQRVEPNHPGPPRRITGETVVGLHRKGLTDHQIADELGCGKTTVRERLHEAGIRMLLADPAVTQRSLVAGPTASPFLQIAAEVA